MLNGTLKLEIKRLINYSLLNPFGPTAVHQVGIGGLQTKDHICTQRNDLQRSWGRDENMYIARLDLKSVFD